MSRKSFTPGWTAWVTGYGALRYPPAKRSPLRMSALMLILFAGLSAHIARSSDDIPQAGRLVGFVSAVTYEYANDCIPAEQRRRIRREIATYEARARATALIPQAAPQLYAFFPQAGSVWQDLFMNNFVDLDPTSGILDWDCTGYTYDGHRGHDSDIRNFRVQAIGVPIFAALDGTVVAAHDGEPDMNTQLNQAMANYVVLDHGGGHQSIYFHMKLGSVAVTPAQFVKAGTQLGLTGSSGNSTWPHLHFESQLGGANYEPSAGPCRSGPSDWIHQIPIRRELYVRDFSFSNTDYLGDRGLPFDNAARIGTFTTGVRVIYFRPQLAGLPANSRWRARFKRPDGSFAVDSGTVSFGNSSSFRWAWYGFGFNVDLNVTGTWHLEFDVNDQPLIDAPFDVVASDSQIVNRPPNPITTAFDPQFPTVNDVVFCRVQTSLINPDPDYQIVRYNYVWSINGIVIRDVTTAALSDAIPRSVVRTDDSLTCIVTPSDETVAGPIAISTITIGSPCSYSLSAISQSFTSNGGDGSLTVTAPTGCSWAANSDAGWLTITSDRIGQGNSLISYSVTANTTAEARTASFTIQGLTFTVTQGGVDLQPKPSITSAIFDGKKKLTIEGNEFGSAPRVLINSVDKTGYVKSFSDTLIKLKAKTKKLGLTSGNNTLQVIDSTGAGSNVVIIAL